MSEHVSRREINALIRTVRERGADGVFDETVRQAKLAEAGAINGHGLKRQIEYLISVFGLDRLRQLLGSLVEHRADILLLTAEAADKGAVDAVQRAVYNHKQQEASELASSGTDDQVDYLVSRLGGVERVRWLLLQHPRENGHGENGRAGSPSGQGLRLEEPGR